MYARHVRIKPLIRTESHRSTKDISMLRGELVLRLGLSHRAVRRYPHEVPSLFIKTGGAAIEWRERIKPRLESLDWRQAINSEKEVTLTVPAAEWLPKATELLAAIVG